MLEKRKGQHRAEYDLQTLACVKDGIADSSRVCTGAHMYERTSQSGNDEERRPRPAAASRQQKPSRQVRSRQICAPVHMHVASLDSTGAHRTGRASIRSRSSEKCMCSLL